MPREDSPQRTVRIDSPHAGPARRNRPLPRPVRGLVFEMGDVLYDATVWRRWLLRVLTRLGLHTTYRSFYHLWDHDYLAEVHRGRRDFCEAFQAFLLDAGLSRAQIEEVEAACQARRESWESEARLLPGVRQTLSRLRAEGFVLGVLSDSQHAGSVLEKRLDKLGLPGTFATVISSIDLGRTKPDPAGYLAVLEAMGVSPDEAAFVGHDPEELAGAAAVGMATIAFNVDPGTEVEADLYLSRFHELAEMVHIKPPYAAAG